MNSNEFYKKLNEKISTLDKEQLESFINNIIRKIPESKYIEVLDILGEKAEISEENYINKINTYKEKFKQIDGAELTFYLSSDESDGYDYWNSNWTVEYYDSDNVGDIVDEAIDLVSELTNKKLYKLAKELMNPIIFTNYQAYEEDSGDFYELDLSDLKSEKLITSDITEFLEYAIYVTYQTSDEGERAINIHNYFKISDFKEIKVEDSFKLGLEALKNMDAFWDSWINLLISVPGETEYRLLKEALEYNSFSNYDKYVKGFAKSHPRIYLDLFDFLNANNRQKEIIDVGNIAISEVDDKYIIKSDIALYLANLDSQNKEKYFIMAFISNSNVPNLLRIINNGYFKKYEDVIKNALVVDKEYSTKFRFIKNEELTENGIYRTLYIILNFFIGNFEPFFDECYSVKNPLGWSGSFIQEAVNLLLLYFNKNTDSKVYNSIIHSTFFELGFGKYPELSNDDYTKIFLKWKENFKIPNTDENIKWLKTTIENRANEIVGNSHRGSYFKAAILVVALGEVLESNNIQSKEEFVNSYHTRYVRHRAFRSELDKYTKKITN